MSNPADYDYELPAELIAQEPLANRSDSRLLVARRATGQIEHRMFRDLPEFLRPGDVLVLNDTKVLPARILGRRVETSGRWEGLFLSVNEQHEWRLICKARGKLRAGEPIMLVDLEGRDAMRLWLLESHPGGVWVARPESDESVPELLGRLGRVPLPHYIRRGEMLPSDYARYQTVYARVPGSAAAPTAGLHFTPKLMELLKESGIGVEYVTLHVGLDTFRPIQVESLDDHRMHREWCEVSAETVAAIQQAKQRGGRVVAVGTTTVRTLESAAQSGTLEPFSGETQLFIRPGFAFHAIDALITNFHLPRSTLLVLVSAFGGDKLIRRAYQEAIDEGYRFYSYGDAMLIE